MIETEIESGNGNGNLESDRDHQEIEKRSVIVEEIDMIEEIEIEIVIEIEIGIETGTGIEIKKEIEIVIEIVEGITDHHLVMVEMKIVTGIEEVLEMIGILDYKKAVLLSRTLVSAWLECQVQKDGP